MMTGRNGHIAAFAAAVLATVPAIAAAQDVATFDNAGILLRQTLVDAEAALTRQGYRVARETNAFRLAPDKPYVQAVRAEKDDATSHDTVVVRFDEPPSEPHAFLIWRTVTYKAGAAPTIDRYRAAVREKAGNETYFRTDQPLIEQYVQWTGAGKARRNIWNVLASLPSSYPNPCVVGMGVTSADEAAQARVTVPRAQGINGNAPPPDLTPLAPQAFCAAGLIVSYSVPDRSTGLVTRANLLLVDQPRMVAMAEKRSAWLAGLQAAAIKAARDGGSTPIL